MTTIPPSSNGDRESLALIRDVLVSEHENLERWGDSFDTRAGLILGFSGVLVGLNTGTSVLSSHRSRALGYRGHARLVGVLAAPDSVRKRSAFLRHHGAKPPEVVGKLLTDTIAESNADYVDRLRRKSRRLQLTTLALVVAIAVVGSAEDVRERYEAQGEEMGPNDRPDDNNDGDAGNTAEPEYNYEPDNSVIEYIEKGGQREGLEEP